jgi:hypothetical protein
MSHNATNNPVVKTSLFIAGTSNLHNDKLIIPSTKALVNSAYGTGRQSEKRFCRMSPSGIIIDAAKRNMYPVLNPPKEISLRIGMNTANKHTSRATALTLLKLFSPKITLPSTTIQSGMSSKISVPVLIGTVLKPVLQHSKSSE